MASTSFPQVMTTDPNLVLSESEREGFLEEQDLIFASALTATMVYSAVMAAAGLVGNCLVLHVYFFRFKPSVTRTYILAMAVCDLLTSGLCLPSDMILLRFHYTFDLVSACKSIGAVRGFLVPFSGLILVVVAIDRFRRVCQPTKRRISQKYALLSIGVCALLALGHAVPNTIVRGPQTVMVDGTNVTGIRCDIIGDEYANTKLPGIFRAVTAALIIGCIVIMLVLYSLIGRHLWLHKKKLEAASTVSRKISETTDLCANGIQCGSAKHESSYHEGQASKQQEESVFMAHPQASPPETVEWSASSLSASQDACSSPLSPTLSGMAEALADTPGMQEEQTEQVPTSPSAKDRSAFPWVATSPVTHAVEGNTNPQNKTVGRQMSSQRRRSSVKSFFSRQLSKSSAGGSDRGERRSRSNSQVKAIPQRTTLMLFILTAVFVLSFIPQRVALALCKDITEVGYDHGWKLNVYAMAVRSWFINSAVNPFVYGFVSQQFRQECRSLFELWRRFCCRR